MERCLACFKYLILLCLSTLLVACGGGGSSDASPSPESPLSRQVIISMTLPIT